MNDDKLMNELIQALRYHNRDYILAQKFNQKEEYSRIPQETSKPLKTHELVVAVSKLNYKLGGK